jgi:hypothetical protein
MDEYTPQEHHDFGSRLQREISRISKGLDVEIVAESSEGTVAL